MLEIVLTDNAKFTLQHIFDTIELKFGEKAADDFLFEVDKNIKSSFEKSRDIQGLFNLKKNQDWFCF